ncbi:hypothetical protein SprV_0100174600 [Sparganum proliferum]
MSQASRLGDPGFGSPVLCSLSVREHNAASLSHELAVLLNYNHQKPPLLIKVYQREGFFSGGAGYVLSRGALKLLVEKAIDIHPTCPTYDEDKEDVKMSVCGVAVGVTLYDALDNLQRLKFNSVSPESIFKGTKWLEGGKTFSIDRSLRLRWMPTSVRTISFHYAVEEKNEEEEEKEEEEEEEEEEDYGGGGLGGSSTLIEMDGETTVGAVRSVLDEVFAVCGVDLQALQGSFQSILVSPDLASSSA